MSSENIGSSVAYQLMCTCHSAYMRLSCMDTLFLIRYKDDTTKEQRRKHPRHLAGGDKDYRQRNEA